MSAKDIEDDGVVLKTNDVTVTAFRTPHPPIVDSFAYKFETPDGTIVFSSDTAYNPKLAEFAKGADVLVHEVLYEPAVDRPGTPRLRHIDSGRIVVGDVCISRSENRRSAALIRYGSGSLLMHPRLAGS